MAVFCLSPPAEIGQLRPFAKGPQSTETVNYRNLKRALSAE